MTNTQQQTLPVAHNSQAPILPPSSSNPILVKPPGWRFQAGQSVTPADSRKIVENRVIDESQIYKASTVNSTRPSVLSFASNTVQGPASIVELARALKNDPQLIFEFVYNNIEWEPGWGVQKGGLGCLLDGCGNSFDQSMLLVALLRQAGYTANYVLGTIRLSEAQFNAWFNTTSIWAAYNYCGNENIPAVSPTWNGSIYQMVMSHVWVQVVISGTTYVLDPSYKTYTRKTPVSNLATILGYNASTFMADAQTGATIDAGGNYVQNMNRSKIWTDLQTMTSNLVSYVKNNAVGSAPAGTATVDDLLGGQAIVPVILPFSWQTSLSYEAPGDVPTIWTGDVPTTYKTTLRVQFPLSSGGWSIDQTFTSDQLAGGRLTLMFNGSLQPVLYLNGTAVATGEAQGAGTWNSIQLTVTHNAYSVTWYNQQWWQSFIWAGQYYLIGNAWGNLGRGQADFHNAALLTAKASGAASTSESVMGEQLSVIWFNWAAQASKTTDLVNRIMNCHSMYNHQVGVVGFNSGNSGAFSTDIGGVSGSSTNLNNDTTKTPINDTANAMHGVALEAATLAQITGLTPGISTTTVIDAANTAGNKIYKGTSSNWNTGANVSAALIANGYNSTDMANIYNWYLQWGETVVLGDHPSLTLGSWSGWGDWIYPSAGAFGLINGNYKGGTSQPGPALQPLPFPKKGDCEEADPVNIRTGDYLYRHTDLTIGSGQYPYALSFATSYDSRARQIKGPLGLGWTHNWAASVSVSSDGFMALGNQTLISAAAAITELYVSLDLLSDTARPVVKLVTISLSGRWWVDRLINNVVTLSLPDDRDLAFILLPDGTYNPAAGDASILALTAGAYTVTTPQKIVYSFNTSGQLTSIAYPYGVTISLTYTAGKLTSISNGMGRTLTLSYTGNYITSVSDGTGRSVGYTIDANNQLTQFTDALSQAYTFVYDQPGRMQKYFKPQNSLNPCVTNTYDSLNRISSQVDIMGHTISFYLAGSRSEIVDPVGNKIITYYDSRGNTVKQVDAFGNVITLLYDGLGRIVQKTLPELNYITWAYDSKNNVLTQTHVAKPGSGLANIVLVNTWDAVWNKLKTAKDGNGNITTFGYDATFGNLLSIQRPAVNSQTPLVTIKYNARGQVLSQIDETGIQTQYIYDSVAEKLNSQIVNTNWLCTIGGTVTVGNVLTIVVHDASLSGGQKSISYSVVTGDTLAKIATGLKNAINADSTLAAMGIVAYVNGAVISLATSPGNTTTFTGSMSGGATETLTFVAGKNLITAFGYDFVGNVNSVQDPNGNITTYLFDSLRRLTQQTAPAPFSYVAKWAYDANSNLLTIQRQTGGTPAWQTYTWTYTLSDKQSTFTDPNTTNVTSWFYDGADRLQKVQDAENRIYQYAYDALNRVSSITDPTNVVSEIRGYSANGKLNSIKDARNFTTMFTFDGFDRPNKITYPDGTYEQKLSYDQNGNFLTIRERSGNTIVNTFDSLNRLLTKTPQGQAQVTYAYDLATRLISASTPVVAGDPSTGNFQRLYDSAGRFYKEVYPDSKAVTFTLDSNANITRVQYPDGYYVDRAYDQLNRLFTIKLNGSTTAAATFGYNPLSQRTSLSLSSGSSISYTPQLNEDLTGIAHTFVGSTLALGYGYNKVHQINSQSFSDSTYSWHPGAAATVTYSTANNINEYPQVGASVYSYNSNGCLTADGIWTYGYDTENHLISSSKTGISLAYVYDPFHRQVQKAVTTSSTVKTRYIYSGWQRIADYDGTLGTLQNRYIFGINLDEPLIQVSSSGVLTFLHANYQGSIIATTDASGAVTNKNRFGPFGEVSTLLGTTFGFGAQRLDSETGLYYFKNRYYSPIIGRFLQPDPLGYIIPPFCGCGCSQSCGGSEPSNLNLYSYVSNDPFTLVDPLGLQGASLSLNSSGNPSLIALGALTILTMNLLQEVKNAWQRIQDNIGKLRGDKPCLQQAREEFDKDRLKIEAAYPEDLCGNPITQPPSSDTLAQIYENAKNKARREAYKKFEDNVRRCAKGEQISRENISLIV